MDGTLKKRWVYDVDNEELVLEGIDRVLVLDTGEDGGATALANTGEIIRISAHATKTLRLAKLNSQEKCLWGVLTQLGEDHQASVARMEEEQRLQSRLKAAMDAILNGLGN